MPTPPAPATRRHRGQALRPGGRVALIGLLGWLGGCSSEVRPPDPPARFVGRAACADCHADQTARWAGSHHDLAMQQANEQTVLGDFDDASFTHFGTTTTFSRRDGKFMVRTDGPDGALTDYEVKYTFGVDPLQQYLIELPGGRLQALGVCWDARPDGQRWFHLYPNERIPHDDPLHWTGPHQNWNYMCADCHSTNLRKGYDPDSATYATAWSEIDVSCEACHGPGSNHVAWAEAVGAGDASAAAASGRGLTVELAHDISWVFDAGSPTARRVPPLEARVADPAAGGSAAGASAAQSAAAARVEVETCARCHARRSIAHPGDARGRSFLDTHRPSLLDESLYHADGQIQDEVYVWGSFVQSKMYHEGVTCSDCHEPHSVQLLATGNSLCTRCHQAATFDTAEHHFHAPDSAGASCVECHMPSVHYMVVDPRRDHSLRIPRPDLSVQLGTPNACNRCHTDRSAEWAAQAIGKARGPDYRPPPHYAQAIHAGRTGSPGAERELAALARDPGQPGIARATALSLLERYLGTTAVEAIGIGLRDADALVRLGAVGALADLPPEMRLELAAPLLGDPVRAVRSDAARVLAGAPTEGLSAAQRSAFAAALAEYETSQRLNSDRPWAHVNLGLLFDGSGRSAEAEAAYRSALRVDPTWGPAYVNLADHYRAQGRDDRGEPILRQGIVRAADKAPVYHALGLLLARTQRLPDALTSLERAAGLRPDDARFGYVYALALHSAGSARAFEVLEECHRRHPRDRDVLVALTTMRRDAQQVDEALAWARKLVGVAPDDEGAHRLLAELEELARRRRR